MSTAAAVPTDLRERRRRETRAEIAEAALDLFETQGLAETTAEEIAHRAGVSTRTFFRLCGTKEQAIFAGDDRFHQPLLDAVATIADPARAGAVLRACWARELDAIDHDPIAHDHFLRVRGMIGREPVLLAAAVRRDVARAAALHDALRAAGVSPLESHVLIETIGGIVRASFEQWTDTLQAGASARLRDIFDDSARIALAQLR
jgi:AcrR family transcriptional regulator